MTNWHFRLRAGGVENSYYIVASDREQALREAQQALSADLRAEGIICLTASVELEERFDI